MDEAIFSSKPGTAGEPLSALLEFQPEYLNFFYPDFNHVTSTPMHGNPQLLSGGQKVSSPSSQLSSSGAAGQPSFLPPKNQWNHSQPVSFPQQQQHHHHIATSGGNGSGSSNYLVQSPHSQQLLGGGVFYSGPMVHPGQTSSNTSSSGQQAPASPVLVAMPPQRSQNIQIANSSYGATDSCPLPGTSLDQSSAGSSNAPAQHSSWVSPPDNRTLNFENRLITDDSLYPTLVPDLNSGDLSGDILEYLPNLEDSKGPSDPSDSQGLMWELDPDDDRITDKLTEESSWSQQPMDFDVSSVFKSDIKSEYPGEPTLAELNANEDSSLLDSFDVNRFLMESFDKKSTFSQPVNLLPPLADVKVEPNVAVGGAPAAAAAGAAASSWSGSSFVESLQAQSSSQSSGLQTLSPPSGCQVAPVGPTFLNPLPPDVYSTLSSSLPSTSSGLPGKQHPGGGKATSRSFVHVASPLHSPARKNPLASGKPKGPIGADRLSTSAPSTNGMDQMWKARKAEVLRTGRLRHGSTDTTLSQLSSVQLTMDEGFSSQEADEEDDSDNEDRSSGDESGSDNEHEGGLRSPMSPSSLASDPDPGSGKKKGKYFWQYNVQAKGPKGPRMKVTKVAEDPHVLSDVTDPVFSPDCQLEGVKHAGKARRGDGNDLTPNPNKLYNIGVELDKLNRIINDLTPPTDLPSNARNKSRKEKNKLASRACRLKKKAQHEANKLKLFGLQVEHKRLIEATAKMRQLCVEKAQGTLNSEEHKRRLDLLVSDVDKIRVAGHTAEYVNKILGNVNAGVPKGGIDA